MAEQIELDVNLAKIKQELADLRAELLKTGQVGTSAFSSITKEVEALSKEGKELASVQREVSDTAKQADKSTGGFGARVKNTIRDTQIAGKSVGEWSDQLSTVAGNLVSGAKSSGIFQTALRGIGVAIKATGIGLLIGLVLSAIQYFTRFQSGMDKVSQVTAGLGAVVDVLVSRFLKLGSAVLSFTAGIGKLITGDAEGAMKSFSSAADDAAASVNGITAELVGAARAAAQLEKDRQVLRDFVQDIQKRTAQREVDAAAAARFADDETKSIRVRLSALGQEGTLKKQIAEDELEAAKERQRIALRDLNLNAASRENADKRNEAEAAAIEVIKATGKVQEAVFDAEKKQNELRKKAAEERQKQLKQERDDLEKLRKDLDKLRVEAEVDGLDKDLASVNKKYDDLIRTAQNGVNKLNEIEKRRGLTPEEQAQRKEFSDLSVTLEERRMEAILDVLTEYNEKELDLEEEQNNRRKELAEKDQKALLESINAQKALRDTQLKQGEQSAEAYLLRLEQQGASENEIKQAREQFDLLIQQARLRAELEFQEKLLSVTDAGDKERTAQIRANIDLLKSQLQNVDFQIDNPEQKKGGFDFFRLLGLDPDDPDFDRKKKAVEKAFSDVIKGLESVTAARVEAAEAEVELATERVEAAEDALDREIEIAQLGFASNVDLKKQELEEAKKAREKALDEQKKAQRQQLIVDSISQASNIAVSSTNLIRSWSSLPFGIGLVLAFAQVAQIVAFMAGIRSKAKAISAQQFRHGGEAQISGDGFITGPSHEGGGVVPEVEGGEFFYSDGRKMAVVKKEATREHFALLRAVNNNDRPTMRAYLQKMTGGISRNVEATEVAASAARETMFTAQRPDAATLQLWKKNNQLVEENNRLTQKLLDAEKDRVQIFDMGDYYLRVERGKETRIKKGA